jgi:hypothetical protein
MEHFIRDVRKDLGIPNLPFVVAAIGQDGSKPAAGAMLTIREAQLAMNDVPEFKGNVKAFRTDLLVDKAAETQAPRRTPVRVPKIREAASAQGSQAAGTSAGMENLASFQMRS